MSGNNDGWSFNRFDEYEAKLSGEQQAEETGEVEQIDERLDEMPAGDVGHEIHKKAMKANQSAVDAVNKTKDKKKLKEEEDIILGEDSRRMSNKQHTARVKSNIKSFGDNYTPPSNYDPDANRGQGEVLTRKQIEKKRRKGLRQEGYGKYQEGGEVKDELQKRASKGDKEAMKKLQDLRAADAKKDLGEGIDFKGAKRVDDARAKAQAEKDKKNPSGKDRRLAMGKFRPGASNDERAEGHRDNMREKGTSPIKDGKKMFEALKATGLFSDDEIEALIESNCGDRSYPSGQKLQKGGEVKDCEKCKGKGCDHCDGKGTHKKEEVKEAAKPDFLDMDGDGNKEEPMKKALKEKGKKKEEVKEDMDPMVEAAMAALAPLLAKAGGAAKAAGAAAKGSKLGAMAKGAAKDAAMDLGTSAVKGIASIPGKIGNAISDSAKKTVSSEDEE